MTALTPFTPPIPAAHLAALLSGGRSAPSRGPAVPDLLFDFPRGACPWIPLLASFFLILCLALFVFFFLRRRRRAAAGIAGRARLFPPSLPPEREALDAIGSLEARLPFANPEEEDSFYVSLSRTLRIYLEGRFGLAALPMTSREVLDSFAPHDPPPSLRNILEKVLTRCEAVEFSPPENPSAGSAAARESLEAAALFVRGTAAGGADRRKGEEGR